MVEQLPNLRGDAGAAGQGIHASALTRKIPNLGGAHGAAGHGILSTALPSKIPNLGGGSKGVNSRGAAILEWMRALSDRYRDVRVTCGDWLRVLGPAVTTCIGLTGIFFDGPYSGGADGMYTHHDKSVSGQIAKWAVDHGNDPLLRIAVCGYEGDLEMPDSWQCHAWKASGGYGSQRKDGTNKNAGRERIWFSPHCLPIVAAQGEMFDRRSA